MVSEQDCKKFVIPNLKENSHIFIGTYVRAHEIFENVIEELKHSARSDDDEVHQIELLAEDKFSL